MSLARDASRLGQPVARLGPGPSAPAPARLRLRLGRPPFQKSVSILLGIRFTSSTGTRGAATGAALGCAADTSNPASCPSSATANRGARPRPQSPRALCPRRVAASRWAARTRRPPHRIGRGLRAVRLERGPQARGAESHVKIDLRRPAAAPRWHTTALPHSQSLPVV